MEAITNKSKVNFTKYYSGKTKTQRAATSIASFALPGLGQVINGENAKGIAFLLRFIAQCYNIFSKISQKYICT